MKSLELGNQIPLSALPTVSVPKIFGSVMQPIAASGGLNSIPRGIDTTAGRNRLPERRELPVGIQSSAISFEAAAEPTNFATLEPVSPV